MKSLNDLNHILLKFSLDEKKSLIKYLQTTSEQKNNQNKSLQLLNLLTNKNTNSLVIQDEIYGEKNYVAFNKLVTRLKSKALEVLLLDSNLFSGVYSKRNEIIFELKKKLIQADVLQLKGVRNEVLPIYNSIIKKSKEFELYDILIQSLYSLQRLVSVHGNRKLIAKNKEETTYYEQCWILLNQSQNLYNETMNKISISSNFSSYSADLTHSINKLSQSYEITRSPLINYYLLNFKVEVAQNQGKYFESETYLEQSLDLLNRSRSVYTPNRHGSVLINMANNYIYLKQFSKSIELIYLSKEFFKNVTFTLRITDEILFYSYFYSKEYDRCMEVIGDQSSYDSSDFLSAKFEYFKAYIHFIKGNFKESLDYLKNVVEIKKDKEGWNVNHRILLLLCRIELKNYESVDLQLQNLEKFIKRISKNKIVRPRFVLILKILIKLVNENFNFEKVYRARHVYFELLESNDINHSWQFKTPELIDFTLWYKSKMLGANILL